MEEVIKRIAKKYGIHKIVVEEMIKSHFSLVRDVMKNGEFEAIRLESVGIFAVKPGRLDYVKEVNKKSDGQN